MTVATERSFTNAPMPLPHISSICYWRDTNLAFHRVVKWKTANGMDNAAVLSTRSHKSESAAQFWRQMFVRNTYNQWNTTCTQNSVYAQYFWL